MVTFIVGLHSEKIVQRVMEINASTKSLVERLCDFKIYAISVLSSCGLGPDLVGIHYISLAARYRVAACSSTLRRGLEKVSAARGHNCAPLFALSPAWEHEFLFPSMAFNTANAFDINSRLDRNDTLDDVPQKKQKAATGLLLDKLHEQDFAGPLACKS